MRVVSAALALFYGFAFFVVCLGTCLAAADEHACCKKGQGFTVAASSTDCCQVTSGVSSKLTTTVAHAPAETAWTPQSSHAPLLPTRLFSAVDTAASPPFILRI